MIWKIPQPVFIDGRLEVIREDFFKEYQKSFEANGLKNLIEKYNPQIFMFDYSYPEALIWDFQLIDLGWRLIYVDGTSAIYAREDYMLEFRDVFINLPAALKKREIADDRKEWNSLRIKRDCGILKWLEGFFKHSSYHADWRRLALFTAVHSRFDYAKNIYLSLLADKSVKTDLGQLYFELGAVYYVTGDLAKAEYCLRWVLEKKPTHEKANKMLKEITGR